MWEINLENNHRQKYFQYFVTGLIIFIAILFNGGMGEIFTNSIFAPHDSFYPINDNYLDSVFGIFSERTNFSKNIVSVFVHIPDLIFIAIFKSFLSNHAVQVLHVIACLMLLYWTSFHCFYKLSKANWCCILLTLAYCFSPYMAILYSSGVVYTLSTVLSIGVLPYFLWLLLNVLNGKRQPNFWPVLVIIALGVLYIFPLLLLIFFGLLYVLAFKGKEKVRQILCSCCRPRDILFLALCLTPFAYFVYLDHSIIQKIDFLSNSTYESLKGGIFYPMMQISSWAIYSDWSPRAILNFSSYYFDAGYKALSIGMILVLLPFLFRSRHYLFIYLMFIAIFFAKGPDIPLGEMFSFIVNHVPLGYMIRSPDSKFGALIAALIALGMIYAWRKKFRLPLVILSLFLLNNIYGMYWHGAISPSKGGAATYYIEDAERDPLVQLINQQDNHLVLTNASNCDGKYYQGLFHTCADVVLSAVDHQIIGSEFGDLEQLVKLYELFPKLIYINHNTTGKRPVNLLALDKMGFKPIYASKNYLLLKQLNLATACQNSFKFSCIIKDNLYLISAPLAYVRFYYPSLNIVEVSQYVSFSIEPAYPKNIQLIILVGMYILCFGLCAYLYFRSNQIDAFKKNELEHHEK
jgi:hypothetical protein